MDEHVFPATSFKKGDDAYDRQHKEDRCKNAVQGAVFESAKVAAIGFHAIRYPCFRSYRRVISYNGAKCKLVNHDGAHKHCNHVSKDIGKTKSQEHIEAF